MIERIQKLPQWQRTLIFVSGVMVVTLFACMISYLVLYLTTNSEPRREAIAQKDVQVQEFATLSDDDAYPAALALAEDGTLYTGSFVSGTIWKISSDGQVQELPDTKNVIGAVAGLDVHTGDLYVLDVNLPLRASGGTIWRIRDGESPEKVQDISTDALPSVNDILLDNAGNIYVSELSTDAIWRLDTEQNFTKIWTAPADEGQNPAPAGLAYDIQQDRLLVVDSALSRIYAVSMDGTETTILYTHDDSVSFPLLDGITVTADGRIFVAATGSSEVSELIAGELIPLARNFRNSSDVAYDSKRERLYVTNSEQRTLLPEAFLTVIPVPVNPHLPFAIDVVTFDRID